MSGDATVQTRIMRALEKGPLYEGAIPLVAGTTPAHARRILRYFADRPPRRAGRSWNVEGDVSALAEALVAAQAELPCALGKDADGQIQSRTYRYLTLDKLIAETRPILQAHGLAIVQWPSYVDKGNGTVTAGLTTELRHVSGDSQAFTMPLYVEPKTMQGLGAAITYARRYAWQSVLGIAAEEDTDAPAESEDVPF